MPIWIVICYLAVSAGCLFSVAGLYRKRKKQNAKAALSAYLSYTVVFLAIWIFMLTVPSYLLLLTMLVVLLACFFGDYLEYYTQSKTFDRYLHVFGSFSFALFTYGVLDDLVEVGGSKTFLALCVFLIGNTLGALFELIEAHHDTKNKVKSQKGLKDTDMDMLSNLIGSVLAGAFAYFQLL